jgi:60 kDa SS-A/Ro ribonucleoprotein
MVIIMTKRQAKKRISNLQALAKVSIADHFNKEDYPSFHRDIREEFLAVLLTNQMRDTFYANAEELSKDAVEMHKKMAKTDILFYQRALVYARNFGYARLQPQIGLVNLSSINFKKFKEVFNKVCLIPTDLTDFIDFSKSGVFRKGIGTGVKSVIIDWLKNNLNEYYALKYRQELKDAIRLARPSEEDLGDEKSLIVDWIFDTIAILNIKHFPKLNAFEKLKKAKPEEVAELIREGRLPHEIATPFIRTADAWKELAIQMPYFALVRHLNTLRRHGCFQDFHFTDLIAKKLENEEVILNSKVYPFRFYSAYKMVSKMTREEYFKERDYLAGKPLPKPEDFVPELLGESVDVEAPKIVEEFKGPIPDKIKGALENAFKISFKNVPEIKGKSAIAIDVSGSMEGKYKEIAATLGIGLLLKSEKKGIICFDDKIHVVPIDTSKPLKTVEEICNVGHGGTDISLPVNYLTKNDIKVDNIIIVSDMQEWLEEGFKESFMKYRKSVNKEAKAFLINVSPYRDYPAPSGEPNVYVIAGWNEKILNYIALVTTMKEQITDIEKSDLPL